MSESHSYQDPVAKILNLEEETNWQDAEWIDYSTTLGLTIADVPELIRLSWDEEPLDCESVYYSIHALRAIIQLDPETGINHYIDQLNTYPDDDFLHEEVDGLSRRVGAIAIAPFIKTLGDTNRELWLRSTVTNGLVEIGKTFPECRDACIKALIAQLQNYREQDDLVLNSVLVDGLIQLKAVEAETLIAEVYTNCEIDEWLTGSWSAAQVEMGLKQESDFPPEELRPKPPKKIVAIQKMLDSLESNRNIDGEEGRSLMPKKPVAKGFGSSKHGKSSNKNKKRKNANL